MPKFIKNDRHTLQYGIIATLIILNGIFYSFPRVRVIKAKKHEAPCSFIVLSYTKIDNKKYIKKPIKSVVPAKKISLEPTDDIFKEDEDVIIDADYKADSILIPFTKFNLVTRDNYSDNFDVIVISYKIGIDGKIKDYLLLKNTRNDTAIVSDIVEKACSKIWDCKYENGKPVEYYENESYIIKKDKQ